MNKSVLICGAGPTGLMMAHELARYGIKSRIIDTNKEASKTSKALIIQPRTLEIFKKIGIIEQILSESKPMPTMNIHINSKKVGEIKYRKSDSDYFSPTMVSQSHTEKVLTEKLAEYDIEIERETSLKDFYKIKNEIVCTLNNNGKFEDVTVDYLIGADGAHSQVRKSLEIPFEGNIYEMDFIQADIKVDWEYSYEEGRIFLNDNNVVAFLPMHGEKRYRIICVNKNAVENPDLQSFQNIANSISSSKIELSDPTWLIRFKLHHRVVPYMSKGNIFIAGDAAHIHSPVGGQGMNTGLQDSYNLAWKLAIVIKNQAHKKILASYNNERQKVVTGIVNETDLIFKNAIQKNSLIINLRNFIAPVVFKQSWLIKSVSQNISQLKINYCHASSVKNNWNGFKGIKAGKRLPDCILYKPSKKITKIHLHDLWLQSEFSVLIFAGKNQNNYQFVEKIGQSIFDNFGHLAKVSMILGDVPAFEPKWKHDYFIDPEYLCHDIFGADESCIYIIRPDGYIGYRINKNLSYKLIENYFTNIMFIHPTQEINT